LREALSNHVRLRNIACCGFTSDFQEKRVRQFYSQSFHDKQRNTILAI